MRLPFAALLLLSGIASAADHPAATVPETQPHFARITSVVIADGAEVITTDAGEVWQQAGSDYLGVEGHEGVQIYIHPRKGEAGVCDLQIDPLRHGTIITVVRIK